MQRIGVAFPGGDPSHVSTWSGTPAGIIAGLADLGVEAVPLTIGAPRPLRALATNALALAYLRPNSTARATVRRARGAAKASPLMARLDSATTPARLGEAEGLDGIVQIGTGVTLRSRVPIATYEDMTVAQNRTHPYEQFSLLSESAIQARVDRQAEAYRFAVACCTATDWAARSIIDDYGIQPDKVHVVGIGANTRRVEACRDFGAPKFLFVGLDWERKNGPAVVRAFERLRRENPTVTLDVVGGHPPLSVDGVTGHGHLRRDNYDDRRLLDELFARSTCFVMPSLLEAAGIVYVEASSAGIPVVASNVGGGSWLVGDGGIAVDPSDDDAILAAMRTFTDPVVAARTGELGRDRARQFTWRRVAEGLLDALAGHPAPPLPSSARRR